MSGLLQGVMDYICARPGENLYPQGLDGCFTVKKGDNTIQTCFQYAVMDRNQDKVMTLKIYDKTLDLMSREGTKAVGSRFSNILGSNQTPGILEESVRLA